MKEVEEGIACRMECKHIYVWRERGGRNSKKMKEEVKFELAHFVCTDSFLSLSILYFYFSPRIIQVKFLHINARE